MREGYITINNPLHPAIWQRGSKKKSSFLAIFRCSRGRLDFDSVGKGYLLREEHIDHRLIEAGFEVPLSLVTKSGVNFGVEECVVPIFDHFAIDGSWPPTSHWYRWEKKARICICA